MKGAMAKRYASYRYQVAMCTQAAQDDMAPRPYAHTMNHTIPITRGFKIGITAKDIGSRANLEWVPFQVNLEQGQRITAASIKVMRKLGYMDKADYYESRLNG